MEEVYTSYSCVGCGKTLILLTTEVNNTLKQGRYISCSHCGCKKLKKITKTSDLKKCMKHSGYKREGGALRQVNYE